MVFGNIYRQKPSEDLIAVLVAGYFQCGRKPKSSFAHASPSHAHPMPTTEPGLIFRVVVTCPQMTWLCQGSQFALCHLYRWTLWEGEVSHAPVLTPHRWISHETKVEGMIEICSEIKSSSVCYEPDLLNYPQILFFIWKCVLSWLEIYLFES